MNSVIVDWSFVEVITALSQHVGSLGGLTAHYRRHRPWCYCNFPMNYREWYPRAIPNTPDRDWQRRKWLWQQNSEQCNTWTTFKVGSRVSLFHVLKNAILHSITRDKMQSFLLRFQNLFSREILFSSKQKNITEFFSKAG